MKRHFAALIVFLVCTACSAGSTFELSLEEVRWIPKSDLSRVVVSELSTPKTRDHQGGYFIVSLLSNLDLISIMTDKNFVINPHAEFCEYPNLKAILSPGGLYKDGVDLVDIYLDKKTSEETRGKPKAFKYTILLFDSWKSEWSVPRALSEKGQKEYVKYDQINEPKSVCLYLRGGRMKSGYLDLLSEQVRIMAADFSSASP